MSRLPVSLRPQRRRVFFGCEGESERSYGTLLNKLLDQIRPDVHLDVVLLQPGSGDHLALVHSGENGRMLASSKRKIKGMNLTCIELCS